MVKMTMYIALSSILQKYAVAKIVNSLKGASSRKLRNHYPESTKHFYKDVL